MWLSALSTGLRTKGSQVRFPMRAHAWVVGQVPSRYVTEQGMGGSFTINYYRKDSAFLSLEVPSPTPLPARFAMPAARGRTSLNARDW